MSSDVAVLLVGWWAEDGRVPRCPRGMGGTETCCSEGCCSSSLCLALWKAGECFGGTEDGRETRGTGRKGKGLLLVLDREEMFGYVMPM